MSQKLDNHGSKSSTTMDKSSMIAGLDMAQVTPKKTAETSLADLKPGDQFTAEAQVLGKNKMNLKGSVLDDGTQFLSIPFEKTGFTFEQLFSGFESTDNSLFVFDNVDIHIEKSTEADSALTVDFGGDLRIDKAPLKVIAKTLNIDSPPMLSAEIKTADGDLSDKITPQSVLLKGTPTIEVNIFPKVSLTETCLEVAIEKNTKTGKWDFQPSAKGTIEIADITDDCLALNCDVSYADESLTLNATTQNVKGLFDVPELNLDTFTVNTVLGKAKSLTVGASFTADNRTYQLGGAIDETKAGIFTRESKFSMTDFNNIVSSLTGDALKLPEYDVSLKNLLIGFANADGKYDDETLEKGITLQTDIEIFDHKATVATHFNREGVELSASLEDISIGPVTIKEAQLAFNLYNKSSKKDPSFEIMGEASIKGIDVECKLVYEKHNDQWQSILYAMLNSEGFVFSQIIPNAKGTFVDTIEFKKVGFIYASFAGDSQDKDFQFKVKKGLQLVGNLKQVPALSDLTQSDDLNMILSASFGDETSINIALPDTKLNLGKSVKTSPISMGINILPTPSLEIVFGLDATVPNQSTPLHFDANLEVGVLEAKGGGTMKNYWENPFGVQGLKIGPELALQVGIIYQQFVVSGIPSSFGFVGGLALGDVTAQMAVNISENPTEEILMGKLESLSPANLVSFVNQAAGTNIGSKDVPNFFDLKDLEIYVAPTGGSIGTVEFEKGFSFSGDLVLFGKNVSVSARIADNGFEAEGHLDKIDLGPLKIGGKKGGDAELDIELTTTKQSVFIDGEIEFLGSGVGLFADISNKGIEFSFEQSFVELLKYTVEGKSQGSISDPKSLDFSLRAEFDNALTAYLKNDLTKKIDTAIKVVNTDIQKAQDDVDKAEKAYKAEFDKAQKELAKAKSAADKYLQKTQKKLTNAKTKYRQDITAAKNKLAMAKAAYDKAFNAASAAVNKAQADYNRGISQAQAKVDAAQRDYTKALTKAQKDVKNARKAYDNAMSSAKRSFNAAQKKVNSLNSSIRSAKSKLKKETRKWFPNPIKVSQYGVTIAGLETAKATATVALSAAKGVMSGVTKGAEYAAFESANAALEAVKQGGKYAAFESAKAGLKAAKTGAKYAAFESAKATLKAVQKGSEYTAWQAAEKSLTVVDEAGKEAINVAQIAVKDVGKSAVYVAFKTAQGTLEAVKQGSAFVAFQSAQVVLEGAKQSAQATLQLSKFIASHSGDIIDVRHVVLESHLKGILAGDFFSAQVDLSLVGKDYKTTIDFDVNDVGKFIESLFKKAMSETERLIVSIG